MKRIVLVADDYGQAQNISQGILNLIQMERLTAVSCLVNAKHWLTDAVKLLPYRDKVSIGLHFNLTEGEALSNGFNFNSLSRTLIKANCHALRKAAIETELRAQIKCFVDTMGFFPHHLDGHQHVHQFPIVRDAMINVYNIQLREHGTYIRLVNENIRLSDVLFDFKKLLIHVSGTRKLKQLLKKEVIPHNHSFSGTYNFGKTQQKYRQLFRSFLLSVSDCGLIMCHPGLADDTTQDIIGKARSKEYEYFISDTFLEDCQAANVQLIKSPLALS